ncbi:LOW QUALITY PROTEIN: hypothetical protein CVT26_011190 [Gymnopilus dilepis]|uniref:Uncharacterized protein n=1 Tax=Gymnopilus dilepis TaxID=231916 RepID=A0A409VJQ6_9AGAR|nr:LOW QUALITY PROTEIN: hypothetical protein CVT26_011190 [Gymnopilus dilepis]
MSNSLPRFQSISPLERMLLGPFVSSVTTLLDHMLTKELHVLSKLNKRMRLIVQFYVQRKWSAVDFLHSFFHDPHHFLDFMKNHNVILFGAPVFQFFDRTWNDASHPLELCLHVESLQNLVDAMEYQHYEFRQETTGGASLEATIQQELQRTKVHKLKSSGERNSSELDRSPWGPYLFTQGDTKRLRIHIVRCDPYRHIFTFYSSALMNFICWNCAVSLFPRSTFIKRRTFVTRQEDLEWRSSPHGYHSWFEGYAKKHGIKTIGLTLWEYSEVETGQRFEISFAGSYPSRNRVNSEFIYRGSTLTIYPGPTDETLTSNGPSFEVLDFKSGVTRTDSYLRIGEPKLWRFVYVSILLSQAEQPPSQRVGRIAKVWHMNNQQEIRKANSNSTRANGGCIITDVKTEDEDNRSNIYFEYIQLK